MNQSVVSSDAMSRSWEYPDVPGIVPTGSGANLPRPAGSMEYRVSLRPKEGGIVELVIPLSRPLRPGVLHRLASHKDREGLLYTLDSVEKLNATASNRRFPRETLE